MKRSSKSLGGGSTRKRRSGGLSFSVPIVERSKLHLWREYWLHKPPTERAVKANRHGALTRSVTVMAKTKAEAAAKAEAENPGCVAPRDTIGRGLR